MVPSPSPPLPLQLPSPYYRHCHRHRHCHCQSHPRNKQQLHQNGDTAPVIIYYGHALLVLYSADGCSQLPDENVKLSWATATATSFPSISHRTDGSCATHAPTCPRSHARLRMHNGTAAPQVVTTSRHKILPLKLTKALDCIVATESSEKATISMPPRLPTALNALTSPMLPMMLKPPRFCKYEEEIVG